MFLPRTEVRLTGPQFPGSSFSFPRCLKMDVMLPFFQSLGTLPEGYDFSDMMESSLATTGATSLKTLG